MVVHVCVSRLSLFESVVVEIRVRLMVDRFLRLAIFVGIDYYPIEILDLIWLNFGQPNVRKWPMTNYCFWHWSET